MYELMTRVLYIFLLNYPLFSYAKEVKYEERIFILFPNFDLSHFDIRIFVDNIIIINNQQIVYSILDYRSAKSKSKSKEFLESREDQVPPPKQYSASFAAQ
jgi:hypothetical protein